MNQEELVLKGVRTNKIPWKKWGPPFAGKPTRETQRASPGFDKIWKPGEVELVKWSNKSTKAM
jgi:hypothetical protein